MKKLLILAAALLTLSAAAQTKEADALKAKLEKSDAAIADAKKAANSKTWIDRANLKVDAATIFTATKLVAGMTAEQIMAPAMAGKPISIEDVTISGAPMSKYSYDHFDMYANEEGVVQFWVAKTEILPNALNTAIEDLQKAKELNPKDFNKDAKGAFAVDRICNELYTSASNNYMLAKKSDAAMLFELAAKARSLNGIVDTAAYFNAGVVYFEDSKFDKALPLFEKVDQMGYMGDGTMSYYISTCLDKVGQKDKALAIAEAGFAKYPSNTALVTGLINLYLSSNQNPDKLIALIGKAQELDPKNSSLYLVESDIYTKLGQQDKAYEAINKALELDPKNYNTLYNLGIMKMLESDGLVKEAEALPISDNEGYDKLKKRIVELRTQAVDSFEKALEVDPKNADLVELLGQLCFTLRDDGQEMKAKHDKYTEMFKQMTE